MTDVDERSLFDESTEVDPSSKIVSIRVDGLIGRGSPLQLELADDHPVLLTGSSGSGKSTLLRGIHALSTGNLPLLHRLPFERLTLERDTAFPIVVEKTGSATDITIGNNKWEYDPSHISTNDAVGIRERASGNSRLLRMDGSVITVAEHEALIRYYRESVTEQGSWLIEQLSELSVPYIADDRLFALADQDVASPIEYFSEGDLSSPVQPHARFAGRRRARAARPEAYSYRSVDLVNTELLRQCQWRQFRAQSQSARVDRELPHKVIEAARRGRATRDAIEATSSRIDEFHRRMEVFDLDTGFRSQVIPSLPADDGQERENAVLHAVLKSYEQKLASLTDLLEDLEWFSNTINRRFHGKTLEISVKGGIRVRLDESSGQQGFPEDGVVPLEMLSSGEQHLVVLLYRLIFGSRSGALFLVDEPELSMHVAWQRELVSDLAKIAKHKDARYLMATHSPAVVAEHLEWEVNFDEWTHE